MSLGAAILRVEMTELGKRTGPMILVRAKIFAKGGCHWHGLFLGAPALECAPEGLGFRVTPTAHVFDGLGIQMERVEDRSCLAIF